MEWWNNGVIGYWEILPGCMDTWIHVDHAVMQSCNHAIPPLPQSSKTNIPIFQHSIIPVVSAANLSSNISISP